MAEVNNIGKVAIITLNLYEVSTGNKIWNDLIKGIPIDDFDPVLSRVGRNFGTSVKARDDENIADVTTYEAEKETKLVNYKTNSFTGLGLGGSVLTNDAVNSRFGLNFFYDVSSVILDINFEYSTNALFNFITMDEDQRNAYTRNSMVNFGMGASKPLTRKRNTAYLTGMLDYAVISQKRVTPKISETGAGLCLTAGGGYMIGRNATTNIRFDFGVTVPTFQVNNEQVFVFKFGIIISFSNTSSSK
jgi:hypothetical protein